MARLEHLQTPGSFARKFAQNQSASSLSELNGHRFSTTLNHLNSTCNNSVDRFDMTVHERPIQSSDIQSNFMESAQLMDICHAHQRLANNIGALLGVTDQPLIFESHATVSGTHQADYFRLGELNLGDVEDRQVKSRKTRRHPIEVLDLLANAHTSKQMGACPEMHRSWLFVDQRLFIWNYQLGNDLVTLDNFCQSICAVHFMTKPQRTDLPADATHLLVVATTLRFEIYGIVLTSNGDELTVLMPAIYGVDLQQVASIMIISSSEDGRIFAGSSNGNLIECVYGLQSSWIIGKRMICTLIDRSTHFITKMLPNALKNLVHHADPIKQIVINSKSRLLFARTEKSNLMAFDLGQQNSSTCNHLRLLHLGEIGHFCQRYCPQLDAHNFARLININLVENNDMNDSINLVAVTNTGIRIYFTCYQSLPITQPTTFRVIHMRLPPANHLSSAQFDAYKMTIMPTPTIHAMVARSINDRLAANTLVVYNGDIAANDLILTRSITAHQSINQESMQQHCYCETVAECELNGIGCQIYAIEKAGADRIVLVTNRETMTIELMTRERLLYFTLLKYPIESDVVRQLVNFLLHPLPASVTCVSLAAEHTSFINDAACDDAETANDSAVFRRNDHEYLVIQCLRLLNEYAKDINMAPVIETNDTFVVPSITLALYEHFSSIVTAQFLNRRVFQLTESSINKKLNCLVPDSDWMRIIEPLTRLQMLLQMYMKDNYAHNCKSQQNTVQQHQLNTSTISTRFNQTPALRTHCNACSIGWLTCHIERVVQTAQLMILLLHIDIETLVPLYMPRSIIDILNSCTIDTLIARCDELCGDLIQCTLKEYMSQQADPEDLCRKLRQACPSIFDYHHAIVAKAIDIITSGRNNIDGGKQACKEAVEQLKPVVQYVQLSFICAKLLEADFYTGIIELCVQRAKEIRKLVGPKFVHCEPHALPPNVLDRLDEVYAIVVKSLDELEKQSDPTKVQAMLKEIFDIKDDQLLHEHTFSWLVDHQNLHSLLMTCESRYVEQYLKMELERSTANRRISLQWLLIRYYELNKNYNAAMKLAFECAQMPSQVMTIGVRRQLLKRAQNCAQSARAADLIDDFRDYDEVALIQESIVRALDDLSNRTRGDSNQFKIKQAISELNSQLIDISTLYTNYAEEFNLYEQQLDILLSARHTDQQLIDDIYSAIVDEDFDNNSISTTAFITKLQYLRVKFDQDVKDENGTLIHFVPKEHLLNKFIVYAYERNFSSETIAKVSKALQAPLDTSLSAIKQRWLAASNAMDMSARQLYLYKAIAHLLEIAINNGERAGARTNELLAYIHVESASLATQANEANLLGKRITQLQKQLTI